VLIGGHVSEACRVTGHRRMINAEPVGRPRWNSYWAAPSAWLMAAAQITSAGVTPRR